MLSYHNDPKVKEFYQARFEDHRALDAVVQGTGYNSAGRGCFVGCTLKDYDHSRFPVELGWPVWLAHLADKIFEGVPKSEAAQFGTDLLAAVPVGKDLEPVRHLLAIRRLDRLIELQKECKVPEVLVALKLVRDCHEAEINGNFCDFYAARSEAWSAARSAAASAARSAELAAASAWSAAWSAASAAASAAWSAESAAELAATSAAASAVRSAAYQRERDDLLDILRAL